MLIKRFETLSFRTSFDEPKGRTTTNKDIGRERGTSRFNFLWTLLGERSDTNTMELAPVLLMHDTATEARRGNRGALTRSGWHSTLASTSGMPPSYSLFPGPVPHSQGVWGYIWRPTIYVI